MKPSPPAKTPKPPRSSPGPTLADPKSYFDVPNAAVRLKSFWQIGVDASASKESLKDQAKKLQALRTLGINWSRETLTTATRLATRCTEAQLDRLLAQAVAKNIELTYSVLGTIMQVEKGPKRDKLWKDFLDAGDWSRQRLDTEIRVRDLGPTRKPGAGRKICPPSNPEVLADRLRQAAANFSRLCEAVETVKHWLKPSQRAKVQTARDAMAKLEKAMRK